MGYRTPATQEGPQRFKAGEQNQKWPTNGRIGYITPTMWGTPNTAERGTKSEVACKWENWLHNPSHLWGAQRFKTKSGLHVGSLAI